MGRTLLNTRIPPAARLGVAASTLGWLLLGCGPRPLTDAELQRAAESQIRAGGLLETVEVLADPALQGRLAGSPGYDEAAHHVADRFAALGLQPGGGDGYLQHLSLEYNELGAVELALHDGVERDLHLGRDYAARGFSGAGRATAEVVFAGYGMSLPDRGWDDYAGLDAEGKIVLAFKQPPPWTPDDREWGDAHLPRQKAQAAADHGAVGLLLVSRPEVWLPAVIASVLHGPGEQVPLPAIHVSTEIADTLLAGAGTTVAEVHGELERTHAPAPRALGRTVTMAVEATYDPARDTANVIGILPGTDRKLAGQHVILGAHLDHVGSQGGVVYPGANDNASGVATVLAAAEAFVRGGIQPRRTVVFAVFSGEEQKLLGAEAYVADPPLPLQDAVAMVNVDCVGLGQEVKLGGGEAHPALWAVARAVDAATTGVTVEETWYGGGADAQPFFDAGLPTLYVHTTESAAHLHQPTDTVATLEPAIFEAAARVAFLATAAVADGRYDPDPRQPRPEEKD